MWVEGMIMMSVSFDCAFLIVLFCRNILTVFFVGSALSCYVTASERSMPADFMITCKIQSVRINCNKMDCYQGLLYIQHL